MSKLTPEGRRGVDTYSEAELRRFLVEDAVKNHATHLPWAVAAYERIGRLSGKGSEQAFTDVVDEVEALTGRRLMPVGPPATPRELKAFGL